MIDWKSRDAVSGLMFLGIAVYVGVSTLLALDIGSLAEMGPGFFPLTLAIILAGIGIIVLLTAKPSEDEELPVNWRAVILLAAAPIAFGLTVRSLGLVPALLISVTMATLASTRITPLKGVIIIVGVTVFCVAVFKFGIGVPYDLISRRLMP